MKILITIITLLTFSNLFAQRSTEKNQISYCESNSAYNTGEAFAVKRYKRNYTINLRVNGLQVGKQGAWQNIQLEHAEKIKYESELIILNDSVAIQVQLARSKYNGEKELHSKFKVFYQDGSCWKQNGIFYFEKLSTNEINYSEMSVGGYDTVPYIALRSVTLSIE